MKTDPFDLRLRAAASTLLSHMESDLESIGSRAKTTIAIQLFPYLGYKFTPRGNDWTYGLASLFFAGLSYRRLAAAGKAS